MSKVLLLCHVSSKPGRVKKAILQENQPIQWIFLCQDYLEYLKWEKELLGMYVSAHPLAGLKKALGKKYEISSIRKARFTGECLPGDEIAVSVTLEAGGESVKARGIVKSRGETCADIRLLLKNKG